MRQADFARFTASDAEGIATLISLLGAAGGAVGFAVTLMTRGQKSNFARGQPRMSYSIAR
jgi:hypothetical protein